MPKFNNTRIVHHSPDEMLALVADVESYPEFLPLCQRLVVRSRWSARVRRSSSPT